MGACLCLYVCLTGEDKVFVTAFDECLIQHSYIAGWDWVPSQNPPKTHSRWVKYSFATRFIKNETYHGLRSFIHFDYRNKRQKNEGLKHGGRVILYLSRRFVTICFVTNNSACWNSRCHLAERRAASMSIAVTNQPARLRLWIPLQQFDLWLVLERAVSNCTNHAAKPSAAASFRNFVN